MCSTLKRRPGSPSSFLLALLITPPWRSLEAPCVMLLDSLFTQLSVSRQLIFTVLNAKYVHPRPALLTDPFYKCNVITNVKNSCREITTTYLSAGHIESSNLKLPAGSPADYTALCRVATRAAAAVVFAGYEIISISPPLRCGEIFQNSEISSQSSLLLWNKRPCV